MQPDSGLSQSTALVELLQQHFPELQKGGRATINSTTSTETSVVKQRWRQCRCTLQSRLSSPQGSQTSSSSSQRLLSRLSQMISTDGPQVTHTPHPIPPLFLAFVSHTPLVHFLSPAQSGFCNCGSVSAHPRSLLQSSWRTRR
jgi:hypothetical protein